MAMIIGSFQGPHLCEKAKCYDFDTHAQMDIALYIWDIGTRQGKPLLIVTFFFKVGSHCAHGLQITSRQLHLASNVLWNDGRILYNPPG